MMERILNITNGDYLNSYLLEKHLGEAIPFREAMMDGAVSEDIFSDGFIALRARELGISPGEYREKMLLNRALCEGYEELSLWFGKDVFCQMNLLTLLAFLEQISYGGRVVLNYVDDETFQVIEEGINVPIGGYREIYKAVFLEKKMPENFGVLSPEAMALYFDYHSPDGALIRLIRERGNEDEFATVCMLLEESRAYGLSDLQAKRMIQRAKTS